MPMQGKRPWALACLVFALCAGGTSAHAAGVVYVDQGTTAVVQDGSSWATAVDTVRKGIRRAELAGGAEVWVAEGEYSEVAYLQTGIHLYGGFAGNETAREQRDFSANVTVINGLSANDGAPVETVVLGATNSTLDGFTIRGGRGANGAGMLNDAASPVVANCHFTDNQAAQYGGAILNNPGSYPLIENCTFAGNAAGISGGAIANNGSAPEVRNCTFTGNGSGTSGGAIVFTPDSSGIIENCVFEQNATGTGGAAIYCQQASPLIDACLFTDNEAALYGGAVYNDTAAPFYVNCLFAGNRCGESGGAITNVAAAPVFFNCTIAHNTADEDGGPAYNNQSDPAFVNCILYFNDPDEFYNIKSKPSVRYSDVEFGHAGPGNFAINPRFMDPGNGDYGLQPQSWCINAGTSEGAPATDIDGVARPQGIGVDVGAYEAIVIGEREPLTPCGALLRGKEETAQADGGILVLPSMAGLLLLVSKRRRRP